MLPGLEKIDVIHPLLVHFPIAFVLTALAAQIIYIARRNENVRVFVSWAIYLGCVSALIAMLAGFRDADFFGHDAPGHEVVHTHRDIMVWMTIMLFVSAGFVIAGAYKIEALRVWVVIPLLIASVLLVIGADKGAEAVFYHGFCHQA